MLEQLLSLQRNEEGKTPASKLLNTHSLVCQIATSYDSYDFFLKSGCARCPVFSAH